jgi:hypothetical protein
LAVFEELDGQLETQLAKWKDITGKDLPAFNEALRNANTAIVAIK